VKLKNNKKLLANLCAGKKKNIFRSLQKQAMEKLGIPSFSLVASLLALIAYLYVHYVPFIALSRMMERKTKNFHIPSVKTEKILKK
jgi:hypothetical protein